MSIPHRYVKKPQAELARAIAAHRTDLAESLLNLGHHDQQDDIIQHADYTGDS